MIMRERIVTQDIEPIGVHRRHLVDSRIELALGINSCIQIVEGILITHQRHTVRIQIMLIYKILRELDALIGVHQVNLGIRIVRTTATCQRGSIRKDRLALSTALGGDDNHTIRRTGTIQGCGCCILQHINTKNVLGIDAGNSITDTIHIIRVIQHVRT